MVGRLPAQQVPGRRTCAARAIRFSTSAIPPGVAREQQQDVVDAINALNGEFDKHWSTIPEIATRDRPVRNGLPDAGQRPGADGHRSKEPKQGPRPVRLQAGRRLVRVNCLLARRLAERGVRFIQLYHKDWDHHGGVKDGIELKAQEIDRACAALITDLKRRGLFDDTLIVWAGEFGRTPMSQGGNGRDHHNKGFSIWLAGGGIKGGVSHGATDELGYAAVEKVVNVHDLHATMLHLLGIDHTRFTFKFPGAGRKTVRRRGSRRHQGNQLWRSGAAPTERSR